MTPQLKYGIIILFVFLDVCVVVYLFSGNSNIPVKQTAVQQTVSAPPTPPPAQQTVYQPPVQSPPQPKPTQEELQKQAKEQAINACNQQADLARRQINYYREEYRKARRENVLDVKHIFEPFMDSLGQWRVQKAACLTQTGYAWMPPSDLTTSFEEQPLREDCDARGAGYVEYFERMCTMTRQQRDEFVRSSGTGSWSNRGVVTYAKFVEMYEFGLKRKMCANLTGGWSEPRVEELIEQIRTATR